MMRGFVRHVVHGLAAALAIGRPAVHDGRGLVDMDRPFKVSCGGTPERPAPDSASVRVRVTEGF